MSKLNPDQSCENRPLPTPPEGLGDDNLFSDRYSYFKTEIQKWKSGLNSGQAKNFLGDDSLAGNLSEVPQIKSHSLIPSPQVHSNILKEIESNRSRDKENNNFSNLPQTNNPTKPNMKKLVIPKNLNIKEDQLPFFSD